MAYENKYGKAYARWGHNCHLSKFTSTTLVTVKHVGGTSAGLCIFKNSNTRLLLITVSKTNIKFEIEYEF